MLLVILFLGLIAVFLIQRSLETFTINYFVLWLFVWGIISLVICSTVPLIFRDSIVQSHHLEAISDGNSTHGQFFLGSGTIDETPSFTFYRAEGGAFVLDSASAYDSKVYYTTQVPHVEVKCFNENPAKWITWPVELPVNVYCNSHADYKFFVPEGSIKNSYRLDAK